MSLLILLIMVAGITLPVLATSKDVEEVIVEEFTLPTDITYEIEVVCIEDEPVPVETIVDPYEIEVQEMQSKMKEIESIEDEMEWFIAYKNIVNEYKDVIDPPETIYDYFAEDELNMLFGVVQAEVGDEWEFSHKVNAASVIFNRLYSDQLNFANQDTLSKVLVPSEFCTVRSGRYKRVEVSEMTILACEYAFEIADTTNGALFFDNNGAHKRSRKYEWVMNDGAHNFYILKEE